MRHLLISLVTGLLLAMPGHAAQLLTDGSGYTGPVIDIGHVPSPGYYFGNAPRTFGGITISGTNMFDTTVYGQPNYGFGINGVAVNSIMIGSGLSDASIIIDFATPVAVFGAGINYSPGLVGSGFPFPTLPASIAAYDDQGVLIADYDLEALAPIDAGGQNDFFAFRGIDGQGQGISRFVLSGAYIGMKVNGSATLAPPPVVPEPGSWALLLAGFGVLGLAARRQRQPRATA